jgi:hypothetical protein
MTSLIDTSDSQIVYVNSRDRLSGTDSNFTYNVQLKPQNDFDRVVMLSTAIPKSYYAVQNGYNTFTLSENGSSITITVPQGNYTRKGFANQLTTLMIAASATLGNNFTYSVTYPKNSFVVDTGFYNYTVSNNGTVQPEFIFGSQSENFIYLCMGFNPSSTNVFVANSLSSVNVINLQAEDAIFVHSDVCVNYNNNILQEIFSNGGPLSYSIINWFNPNIAAYSKKLAGNQDNIFRFYITNEDGVNINFNGVNVQFTLLFYHEDSIFNRLKAFMQYISFVLFKTDPSNGQPKEEGH